MWQKILGHLVAGLLVLAFLAAGLSKLAGLQLEQFSSWGYPLWFLYGIGSLEIVAALLLLLPSTRLVGAGLVISTMVGAVGTHLIHEEWSAVAAPLVCGLLAVVAGLVGRPD